jgi:hypothetical protein
MLLLVVFYRILQKRSWDQGVFRLILFFVVLPTTIAMSVRNLGRFDLFLVLIFFICMIVLTQKKYLWVLPLLMGKAMFIHEGFLVLFVPTLIIAMLLIYIRDGKEPAVLAVMAASVVVVGGSFLLLYGSGNPQMEFEAFSASVQSRAAFQVTELSIRECYYSLADHIALAAPYLTDPGSMVNLLLALIMLSPAFIVLGTLWKHALRRCTSDKRVCQLLMLATWSGLILIPIATDYGRWLSAALFSNFFVIFFFIGRGILKEGDFDELKGDTFAVPYVIIVLAYLIFGPLNDWNPYPFQDSVLKSSVSLIAVLLFDVGYILRWRSLHPTRKLP